MKKRIRTLLMTALVLLWSVLALLAWISPAKELSETERRPLAQFPEFSVESVLKGTFMTKFEAYSLDQFPMREGFRRLKSLFHFYVLNQNDTNGIYLADGYAVKQEYPMNEESLSHAVNRFSYLYDRYLKDSRIFMAVVPDKGQYLAESSGHLTVKYQDMTGYLRDAMPWASFIDLYDSLDAQSYYQTDIHWRQEKLLQAAQTICNAMDITAPRQEDYTVTPLQRPFYGVYYGQAALPMEAETMYLMESELLKNCRVYDYETGAYSQVYNLDLLQSRDLYDVFLSGSRSLLTVENPNAKTDRELILFRDSFGSSLAPLLVQDYARVTLVDIRYIQINVLDRFLTFDGQDVLFLYSVPVLNNSSTIK